MSLIVLFPSRWFEWDVEKSAEAHKLCPKLSDKALSQLENVGQQLALAFNNAGSALAAGGEVDIIFQLFSDNLLSDAISR